MNDFIELDIHLKRGKIQFEHLRNITFQGVFRRKWFLWGQIELRDDARNMLAAFKHISIGSSFFSRDVRVIVERNNGDNVEVDFVWKQPQGIARLDGREFFIIFHKGFWVSIFEDGVQIASLKIPNSSIFFQKTYKLTVKKEIGIDAIFWPLLGIIHKLEGIDNTDPAEFQLETMSIDPFQRELQPFDPYWKQK